MAWTDKDSATPSRRRVGAKVLDHSSTRRQSFDRRRRGADRLYRPCKRRSRERRRIFRISPAAEWPGRARNRTIAASRIGTDLDSWPDHPLQRAREVFLQIDDVPYTDRHPSGRHARRNRRCSARRRAHTLARGCCGDTLRFGRRSRRFSRRRSFSRTRQHNVLRGRDKLPGGALWALAGDFKAAS